MLAKTVLKNETNSASLTHVVSTLPSAYLNAREHASLAPPRGRVKTRSLATIRTFSRADLRQFSESVQHPMCPISDKKFDFAQGHSGSTYCPDFPNSWEADT